MYSLPLQKKAIHAGPCLLAPYPSLCRWSGQLMQCSCEYKPQLNCKILSEISWFFGCVFNQKAHTVHTPADFRQILQFTCGIGLHAEYSTETIQFPMPLYPQMPLIAIYITDKRRKIELQIIAIENFFFLPYIRVQRSCTNDISYLIN